MVFNSTLFYPLHFFLDLDERHHEVMGAVKSQLETSHQEDLNELTASFLAETAIKVETIRLETEQEWQEKLDELKEKHELELQTMAEKLTQVSDGFNWLTFFSGISKILCSVEPLQYGHQRELSACNMEI